LTNAAVNHRSSLVEQRKWYVVILCAQPTDKENKEKI